MKKAYFLSATLLLAGCASQYGIDVADAGQLPVPAGHNLRVSAAADPLLTEKVMAALTSQGFKVADPADYLVQIVSSEIPGKTGLFLPESPPDASGKQAWLTAPSLRKTTQTRRITVTLTNIATGREVYRASGDERYREGEPVGGDALVDAVMAQIAEQGAISPVPPEGGAT